MENVGPIELHLHIRTYIRPPDILLEEEEAIPCDSDASQYLSLTSSVMGYRRAEVHNVVHQIDTRDLVYALCLRCLDFQLKIRKIYTIYLKELN